MSLFTDLNKANKIMMGLNESELAPQEGNLDEAKKPGKNDKLGDVKGKGVQGDQVDIEEACDPEDDEEDMEEGKCGKKKKCESVDEGLDEYLDEGYEVVEEGLDLYICEDCGALCEHAGECDDCGGVLDEAMKMVVKNGKVVKKQIKRKKQKMSAKQKQALKKAQKKAQSSSAKKARAKSMKVRVKKGLNEAEDMACPVCDYVGPMEEVEDGVFVCPECGEELVVDNEACKKKCESIEEPQESQVNESLELYKNALDIPEFILNEGDDLVKKYLLNVFDIDVDAE